MEPLQVLLPSVPCYGSVRQQPLHWHKQWSAKSHHTTWWWNPALLGCEISCERKPVSLLLIMVPSSSCDDVCCVVETHLWNIISGKNKHECPLGDLPQCTDIPFRRCCISSPHSHTFRKQDFQTAEGIHHKLVGNSNRQAKHSDYNSALSAIQNTIN